MFFFKEESTIWQQDFFKEEYAQHKEACDRLFSAEDPLEAYKFLELKVSSQMREKSSYSKLCAFIGILMILELHAEKGQLKDKKIRNLYRDAQQILEMEGVQKSSIRFCFFNQRLHSALSQAYRRDGRNWLANWHEQVATISRGIYLVPKTESIDLATIEMLLDKGQSLIAIMLLNQILNRKLSLKNLLLVKLLFAKAYHLAGRPQKALDELKEIPEEDFQLRLLS